MNYGFLVTIAAFISIIAASIVGTHIVFASSYEKSQTISQTNDCGNYWFPLNVLCSNVGSQVQGDENSVAITAGQAEGKVESSENFTPFP
ncbi:MAG: hypothetical protein WBL68_05670 [Nitrososphaeraceae archaeon]|jgi:uncharacterized OB-fold protein